MSLFAERLSRILSGTQSVDAGDPCESKDKTFWLDNSLALISQTCFNR